MDADDIFVGHWIDDLPYIIGHTGARDDRYKKMTRTYPVVFSQIENLIGCDSWARNCFQYKIASSQPKNNLKNLQGEGFLMNGRSYYPFLPLALEFAVSKPIKRSDRSELPFLLQPYQDVDYDLSSLICTMFSRASSRASAGLAWNDILDIMKKCPQTSSCDPCTQVGRNIAKSLIKIAALRIFASPEQSIIELPVNSIDAYNPGRRVGKFGMGFFSILYWLIGHPMRVMTIYSFYRDADGKYGTYKVILKEVEGPSGSNLAFSLYPYPLSDVTRTGFCVEILADMDPFDSTTVENFKEQMHKLDFITGAALYSQRGYELINNGSTQNKEKSIAFDINKDRIMVEDFATGVSLETLLGVSFIPSLSTKTIKDSSLFSNLLAGGQGYTSKSRLVGSNPKKFVITVSNVCVVSIGKGDAVFLLDLPPSTRLPVSRDDIILATETITYMKSGIGILFNESALKTGSVVKLQKLLQKYIDFTAAPENKNVVSVAMNDYFELNKENLVPSRHKPIYDALTTTMTHRVGGTLPWKKFVTSLRYDVVSIESWIGKNVMYDDNIWYGLRVIFFDAPGLRVTMGGLINYIFIDDKYKTSLGAQNTPGLGTGWIATITSSFFEVKLHPIIRRPEGRVGISKRPVRKSEEDRSRLGANEDVPHSMGTSSSRLSANEDDENIKYGSLSTNTSYYNKGVPASFQKLKDILKTNKARQFTYATLNKYESMDVYLRLVPGRFEIFVSNLVSIYLSMQEENYITILLEIIRKFSEFKGNQTYGGEKYALLPHGLDGIYELFTDANPFPSHRRESIVMEHIINTIRAVQEDRQTNFEILNDNDPVQIYNLSGSPVYRTFYETVMNNTTSYRDFMLVMAGAGMGFLGGGTTSGNINSKLVEEYAKECIVRTLRDHPGTSLYDLYYVWENESFNKTKMTKTFLIKHRYAAKQWVANFSDVDVSIKIQYAPGISVISLLPMLGHRAKSFKLSTLINYLFVNPVPATDSVTSQDDTIVEFTNFIDKITSLPDRTSPLQIIEIAINEGTTKPFIESVLTELPQNSIDAIRESSLTLSTPGIQAIHINVEKSKDAKTIYLKIRDPVGMNMKAFMYIGIPFLSTKTPSEIVTGEMGSGFFNSYRESSSVIVDTTGPDGIRKISKDVPIKDETGRVLDIEKTMTIERIFDPKPAGKTKKGKAKKKTTGGSITTGGYGSTGGPISTGTTITIEIPVADDFAYAATVGKISYAVKNVLAMALTYPILRFDLYFNDSLVMIPKMLCGKVGHFEIYAADIYAAFRGTSTSTQWRSDSKANYESYLLTKGIPFAPLAPYFRDLLEKSALDILQKNIIVNITHGGYTPVQTRTRINISKDAQADFTKTAHYALFVAVLRDAYEKEASHLLDHYESTASADQLYFQHYTIHHSNLHYYGRAEILKYTQYEGQPSIVTLINACIDILAGDPYKDKKDEIIAYLATYKTKYQMIDDMVVSIVEGWLSKKNTSKSSSTPGPSGSGSSPGYTEVDISKEPDQPEPEIEPLVRKWIDVFCEVAKENGILGYTPSQEAKKTGRPVSDHSKPKVRAVYSMKNMSKLGWFNKKDNIITINTYTWYDPPAGEKTEKERVELIRLLKNVPPNIEAKLKNNELWQHFFAYSFPASTLPHELEHYRRKNEHSGGHDSIVVNLYPGDNHENVSRSFDQVSNAVYQHVLACGFWKKYKDR
jgi:hypothetical protein